MCQPPTLRFYRRNVVTATTGARMHAGKMAGDVLIISVK